jgi:hypothetical protein
MTMGENAVVDILIFNLPSKGSNRMYKLKEGFELKKLSNVTCNLGKNKNGGFIQDGGK